MEGDYKIVVQTNKTEKNKERDEKDHEIEGLRTRGGEKNDQERSWVVE